MSLDMNSINTLKKYKKSVVFSQNSSTSAPIFKYLGGNSIIYKNIVLENGNNQSQIFQSGANLNIQASQINLIGNNPFVTSEGFTGDQGFPVGYPIDKDMATEGCRPLDAAYAPNNIPINNDQAIASYWNDWGDDIFDAWGYFYIFDVATNQYFFPIFNPVNLADGVFTTQSFNAFGRTYTIIHGYPAEGIFKFDISCSDNSEFIFGAYGNMGSDESTENTNLTKPYAINGQSHTLYYNRNIESGNLTERFFSYFVPYESNLNNSKTYSDFLIDDNLSLFSVPSRYGLTVYFSKKNDVSEWVINDLQVATSNLYINGTVVSSGRILSHLNLTTMPDADFTPTVGSLTNSYFISNNLTDNRAFIIPSAANIVSAIPNCSPGTSFDFTINNVQGGAFNRSLVASDSSVTFVACYSTAASKHQILNYTGLITNTTPGSEAVSILQKTR